MTTAAAEVGTERWWLESDDPAAMLGWINADPTGLDIGARRLCKPSDRKLRLFACAVSRWFHPDGYWGGMEANDRAVYAYAEALAEGGEPEKSPDFAPYCQGLHTLVSGGGLEAAQGQLTFMQGGDCAPIADLLRCVVGNPFRPVRHSAGLPGNTRMHLVGPHCIPDAWLTPDALRIATSAYESRDFSELPILADALEDAGCDEPALLGHLRGGARCPGLICAEGTAPNPHARGCWALDLILGRG